MMTNLDRARRICLGLPEATEQEAWGVPTFRVNKKMFAMYGPAGHGREHDMLLCNAPPDMQKVIVASDPERIIMPPYMGAKGWIGLIVARLDDEEIAVHAAQAYCMVAPPKLGALVGA